jgi:hypothetical protein
MDSAPTDPGTSATVFVSSFQHNFALLKATRYINWKRAADSAVHFVASAAYV